MTEIGCGFAKFSIEQIAPLFKKSPKNIIFPINFSLFIENLTPFSIDNPQTNFQLYETYVEVPLGYGNTARLKLKSNELLKSKLNIWEKHSSLNSHIHYLKLDDSQFNELHDSIEKTRKEELNFFKDIL